MNKDLLEIYRRDKLTALIVLDNEYKELKNIVSMEANVSDDFLLNTEYKNPVFKEKLEKMAKAHESVYFVIRNIDKVNIETQDRFIGLVKDRELNGYFIPENCKIVFTIENQNKLKAISSRLYHFCVFVAL